MRIQGTNRAGSTKSVRRSGSQNSGSGKAFSVESTGQSKDAAAISAPVSLTAVDSLLALQEVDDGTQAKKKAVKRAADILDMLEEIRVGLIMGAVPLTKLNNLIQMVENRRDGFKDPALGELIDEIELRARVEIAKLQLQQ